MARIILKCPYIKGGEKTAAHITNLVKYIATREGVEKIKSTHESWHSTKKQKDLIEQIIKEFPDTKDLFEYDDYCKNPNRENASEFISIALEHSLDKISNKEKYLDYIANRPRVEKIDSHGLFSSESDPIILSQVAKEISSHKGNIWTPIISLRREDATITGYDNANSWKALISSKAIEFSDNLKIHPDNFKWYAAFHNESHHPHVHMICCSTMPSEGYLTKQGIKKIKSSLANEIFSHELITLYKEKTQHIELMKEESIKTMHKIIGEMKKGILQNDRIEKLITYLSEQLKTLKGKKQYGYLKAELKNIVDEIVDELAKDNRVSGIYGLWWEVKGKIESIYTESPSDSPLLSKCEDFKSIKNMVIKEALQINNITFEESIFADENVVNINGEHDFQNDFLSLKYFDVELISDIELTSDIELIAGNENEEHQDTTVEYHDTISEHEANEKNEEHEKQVNKSKNLSSMKIINIEKKVKNLWWTDAYKLARQYLYGDEDSGIIQSFEKAREILLSEAETKNPLILYDLGRMSADRLCCETNIEEAHSWYEKALNIFHSAEEENPWKYTEYRIGKMYSLGLGIEQDYSKAIEWLKLSADENYKYAQYSLGNLYHRGNGVKQDYEVAFNLYTQSANQGFPYASFELGKMLQDGIGCIKNAKDSERRFKEAFKGFVTLEKNSCDDKLQYRLGWMLLNGIGTKQDTLLAKKYFEKASSVGNSFACYQLAYMYEKGDYIPKNISEAIRLYTIPAELGNDIAAYRLGKLYLGGEGVLKDVESAICWLIFSAEKNNQFAEYILGMLYLKGDDIPKDIEKAVEYLKRSAEQGNQYAQYIIGKLYLAGKDMTIDKEMAAYWLRLSAIQGNIYAQFLLDNMDNEIKPSVLLAGTHLLHNVCRIFSDNIPLLKSVSQRTDKKLLRKLRDKKQAQGHVIDDNEQIMTL